jgi:23S rRNA pseudouridine2605 synthase
MRLQKFLSQVGVASRRAAEEMIRQGKVKVNGDVIVAMGVKVDPLRDQVEVDGRLVSLPEKKIYLMLDKPAGYLTTARDPQRRLTVYELLPEEYRHLFPVGRLDKDSQGLLLFTNDGDLAQRLMHPSFCHSKQYAVRVAQPLSVAASEQLLSGVELLEGLAQADEIERIDQKNFLITLHQGWKRQIRRMFQAVDGEVVRLERVRLGKFQIQQLGGAVFKEVSKEDIL